MQIEELKKEQKKVDLFSCILGFLTFLLFFSFFIFIDNFGIAVLLMMLFLIMFFISIFYTNQIDKSEYIEKLEKNKDKVLRFYNHYQNNTFLGFKKITEKKIKYFYSENLIVKTSSFPITKIEERTDIDNSRIIISNDNIILQTVWSEKEL